MLITQMHAQSPPQINEALYKREIWDIDSVDTVSEGSYENTADVNTL